MPLRSDGVLLRSEAYRAKRHNVRLSDQGINTNKSRSRSEGSTSGAHLETLDAWIQSEDPRAWERAATTMWESIGSTEFEGSGLYGCTEASKAAVRERMRAVKCVFTLREALALKESE